MSFRSLFSMFSLLLCSALLFLGLTVAPSLALHSSDQTSNQRIDQRCEQGSDPTKGTAQMPESMKAAEDVAAKSAPMSIEEVEERNKDGLNEIQGDADKDKMYNSNTDKPGPAIVKDIKKAIDKAKK
ncbi:MAG: hypothetical protein NT070_14870 [Cyanobacteria bacterium]|nr:hypothetical protein [Cyanobacteriota bacterium]